MDKVIKLKVFSRRLVHGLSSALLSGAVGIAVAHDVGDAGLPVCLEGNFMVADAQNAPFSNLPGAGRVLEMNIFTGERGITVNNPFIEANLGTPIVPEDVAAPGPWKPTGVLSGGLNGHAFITGAAQHTFTEFHRDGTPIRSVRLPTAPPVEDGFGAVPRLLGSQMMPNGNLIQNVCDANFFNAPNTDPEVFDYFPPVSSTPERAQNSRLLVMDQETLEVIDEYSAPDDPRWTCMAGVIFSDEGMYVSMFHGAAVFVIDWKAGLEEEKSTGVGSNCGSAGDDEQGCGKFKLGKKKNKAKVIRVIDLLGPDAPMDDPRRRDSLRAITLDEGGNLYATFRARATDPCLAAEGCNQSVFRQHVAVVPFGEDYPTRTIALDPGVNVIAGIRTNRMSGVACDAINPVDPNTGTRADPDACDVETLLVAASAFNPGCAITGPIPDINACFAPGGGVGEYLIDPDAADVDDGTCSGDPLGENSGCAQPVAIFEFKDEFGSVQTIDPRMLMIIHEAFGQ